MRNLTASLFYFAARVIAAVLQLRFVAHVFGNQYAGLNAVLNQLAFYVALIELGLAAAAISLLFEPIKTNQREHVSGLLYALQKDSRRLMLAALPVVAVLVIVYSRSLHSTLPKGLVIATLSLTAVSGLVTLFSLHFQAYLNASEQMFRIHLVLGCGHIAKTLIGIGLSLATDNYLWMPGTMVAVSACEVLALQFSFHRSFPEYVPAAGREFFVLLRSRAKFVLFHRIGSLIYYQSDFIILSLVTTLALVKDYAQVQYLAMGIVGLFSAVFNALTASIARRKLGVTVETQWKQYRAVALATYFMGLALTLAFFFAAPAAVRLVFGGNAPPAKTMTLFGSLLLLNLIRSVDDTYVTATGAFRVGFYLPVLEGPIFITLGVVLCRSMGMDGVLWAGIITNFLFVVIAKTVVIAYGVLSQPLSRLFGLRAWNTCVAVLLNVPLLALNLWVGRHELPGIVHILSIGVPAVAYGGAIAYVIVRRGYRELGSICTAKEPVNRVA
jgi:O-antigen/teichoic acid export membrane protein